MARKLTGPAILTRAEAAQALGVHPATVARWAATGILPSFRTPSGERRYHRCDVEALLNLRGLAGGALFLRADPRAYRRWIDRSAPPARPAQASRSQPSDLVGRRSRMLSRTACQGGGIDAGDCTVAAAQAIPAEAA